PIVIRTIIGRGWGSGSQHSGTMQGLFAHIPGLKVVMPSTPYDMKGLLLAAVEDDYPVIIIEHRWLYNNTSHVPEEYYTLPIGKAKIVREGKGLTLVATSIAVIDSLLACEHYDLDVEVIDVRTLKPLDDELILGSVKKTGQLLVVDYDFPTCGFASEVCARVAERGFHFLKSPVRKLTFQECHMPASGVLEKAFYPDPERIACEIRKILDHVAV
ncbi:MAG: alpha-ketoacid dehydrogenase subunit beta, partial [Armatimonadetes bacterium]|nr:alpha-ketoacid dehydrogenase subunit beta [Armatimonadota bacterium]